MRAIVLSIGDELLCGDCVDTNSSWLCARFAERGVQVCEVLQIPDDRKRIADAFRSASAAATSTAAPASPRRRTRSRRSRRRCCGR